MPKIKFKIIFKFETMHKKLNKNFVQIFSNKTIYFII